MRKRSFTAYCLFTDVDVGDDVDVDVDVDVNVDVVNLGRVSAFMP